MGTGISGAAHGEGGLPGFVGNATYSERNLFGLNQKVAAQVELGAIDKLFKVQHTDPWVNSSPSRISRTATLMNTRVSGATIHGRMEPDSRPAPDAAASSSSSSSTPAAAEGDAAAANAVLLGRLIASVEWRRPISNNWTGTTSVEWQRAHTLNEQGAPISIDTFGSPLTLSSHPYDTSLVLSSSAAYSSPVSDAQLVASLEQSLPLPVDRPLQVGPVAVLLRARAGSVLGDLPPYEAFPIGGTNSVRGYSEGGVGSGRHVLEATGELRWPLASTPFTATLFADYGSDLGSGSSVRGDPAGVRNKPGSGYGYGGGVRVDSPIGPLRLEYAFNAKGVGRFHVGLGS
ncbi:MAG: hypothetical protein WDW36_001386 [Sanguina aurantia]